MSFCWRCYWKKQGAIQMQNKNLILCFPLSKFRPVFFFQCHNGCQVSDEWTCSGCAVMHSKPQYSQFMGNWPGKWMGLCAVLGRCPEWQLPARLRISGVSTLLKQEKLIQTSWHQQEGRIRVWEGVQGHLVTAVFYLSFFSRRILN